LLGELDLFGDSQRVLACELDLSSVLVFILLGMELKGKAAEFGEIVFEKVSVKLVAVV
jgi:hypothetical protein